MKAATFGWLCVETRHFDHVVNRAGQPPSGGCVLKRICSRSARRYWPQPPSGGCVLKQAGGIGKRHHHHAATFGWLCVETSQAILKTWYKSQPPSGGCVLKQPVQERVVFEELQPPSGGCVLKHALQYVRVHRQQAATFGWLCVETTNLVLSWPRCRRSHLRVAVC